MDDLRAVMDAASSERGVVFGISEGDPMAMLFAATYPDRTRGLLLFGTVADYGTIIRAAEKEAIELDRSSGSGGRRSTRGSLYGRGGAEPRGRRTARRLARLVHTSGREPGCGVALERMNEGMDASKILPRPRADARDRS